jgi:hypothetical protein
MKTTYLFFPVATSFGQRLFDIVSSGYIVSVTTLSANTCRTFNRQNMKMTVDKVYYECIRYDQGRFDEALKAFSQLKGKPLVEILQAEMAQPQALELFSNVLSDGQTAADIRIVVQK